MPLRKKGYSKDNYPEEPSDRDFRIPRQPTILFKPEEVGFFDPYLNVNDYGLGDVTDKGNKVYFRLVHLFIDAARDYAIVNRAGIMRYNLLKCLRGSAVV